MIKFPWTSFVWKIRICTVITTYDQALYLTSNSQCLTSNRVPHSFQVRGSKVQWPVGILDDLAVLVTALLCSKITFIARVGDLNSTLWHASWVCASIFAAGETPSCVYGPHRIDSYSFLSLHLFWRVKCMSASLTFSFTYSVICISSNLDLIKQLVHCSSTGTTEASSPSHCAVKFPSILPVDKAFVTDHMLGNLCCYFWTAT